MKKIEVRPNGIFMSQIGISDIITASEEEKSRIVFMRDNEFQSLVLKYDIAIVLGGVSQDARIEQAAASYHEGKIERIIVSGGIGFLNIDRITTEAEKMRRRLVELDIPSYLITEEANSRSTYENIKNSMELLALDGYDLDETKIAIITSDFHMRRALGMMKKQLPGRNVWGIGAKDGKTDCENWMETRYGKMLINKEAFLLLNSVKTGNMSDYSVDVKCRRRIKI